LSGSVNAGIAVTEASSAPSSGETTKVTVFSSFTAADIDTPDSGDELTGAIVRISTGFSSSAANPNPVPASQDYLKINVGGTDVTSGTVPGGAGITFAYDTTTGMMVFSGAATTAEYAAAIALVKFSTSGDNVTAYGGAGTRTIAASVFDGLLYSDEITNTVSVTGINDAPVNAIGTASFTFVADSVGAAGTVALAPVNAIKGIQVSDVDSDPANQNITVTLAVDHGVLTIRTDVVGGITSGQLSGNGTGLITISATQNAINATLAAARAGNPTQFDGLVFTPVLDYHGSATLTVTTNDTGLNGNDPGLTGGGTDEQDVDTVSITVSPVVDIADDTRNANEDSGVIT